MSNDCTKCERFVRLAVETKCWWVFFNNFLIRFLCKDKFLNHLHKLIMVPCKSKSDLRCSKARKFIRFFLNVFFSSNLVKWMGHIILNLYCTFDKRYFCLFSDLLYEIIVVFVFFFPFVWDIYLNIFLNIIIYILVYSGYHIIIKKYILWSRHLGSNCCNVLFTKKLLCM